MKTFYRFQRKKKIGAWTHRRPVPSRDACYGEGYLGRTDSDADEMTDEFYRQRGRRRKSMVETWNS